MYLKKIIRIRLPDEITDELNKVKRKSEYIRCAIREKMQRDNIFKKRKTAILKYIAKLTMLNRVPFNVKNKKYD